MLTWNEKNDLWTNTTDLDIFQLICGILCPDRPGMLLLPASQGMMPHPASPSELITNSTNKFAWSALARPLLTPLRIQAQNSCTCKPLTCSCHEIKCKKCCTRSTYLRLSGMQSCASFSPKASTTAAWGWMGLELQKQTGRDAGRCCVNPAFHRSTSQRQLMIFS